MKLSEFGQELRRLRIENDLTLADISNKLGCTIAYLSAVERGTKSPTTKLVEGVAEYLQLTLAQRKILEVAARSSRRHLDFSEFGEESVRLFSMLAHQAPKFDADAASVLEQAIGDDETFKRVVDYARKLIKRNKVQPELEFGALPKRKRGMPELKRLVIVNHAIRYRVSPRSTKELMEKARAVRKLVGTTDTVPFPIIRVLDTHLDKLCPGFKYKVYGDDEFIARLVKDDKMSIAQASAIDAYVNAGKQEIVLRESTYRLAARKEYCPDGAKARFAITHELSHALLHAKATDLQPLEASDPLYIDSEWQADIAARHILLSENVVAFFESPHEIAREMLVSTQCAVQHWHAHSANSIRKTQRSFSFT